MVSGLIKDLVIGSLVVPFWGHLRGFETKTQKGIT